MTPPWLEEGEVHSIAGFDNAERLQFRCEFTVLLKLVLLMKIRQ
jgi:hypothetical protein